MPLTQALITAETATALLLQQWAGGASDRSPGSEASGRVAMTPCAPDRPFVNTGQLLRSAGAVATVHNRLQPSPASKMAVALSVSLAVNRRCQVADTPVGVVESTGSARRRVEITGVNRPLGRSYAS